MVVLMKILQVILALSLLVVVHEFGHYLWARIFKIKVEKFYLFFDPFFSLFKYKPKNSDTEFGIGWIPFGGYCKIAGMIDESFDTEQMKACRALGVPFQTGLAENICYGWRSFKQLYSGHSYLLGCALCMGRAIY